MEISLGTVKNKPIILSFKDGIVSLNGVEQPIKNITEADFQHFQEEIDALPKSQDPGYDALVNALRAEFLVKLIGNAVGDECVSRLTHILDHVHYDVLTYLGEVE